MEVPEWLLAAYPNRTLAEPTAIGRSNAIFFLCHRKTQQRLDEHLSKHHKTRSHSCFFLECCVFPDFDLKNSPKVMKSPSLKIRQKNLWKPPFSATKSCQIPRRNVPESIHTNTKMTKIQKSTWSLLARRKKFPIHCADWIWNYINP